MTATLVLLMAVIAQAAEYSAPAGVQPALRRPGAASILPGGRVIAPAGIQYVTGPGPFALAISPSGKTILSANRGPERFSLTLLEKEKSGRRLVRHLVADSQSDDWLGVSTGAVFDGEHTVYVSEGASGRVWAGNASDGSRKRAFELNQDGAARSFTGDLAFDPDRKQLYVLDQANSRLAVVDVNRRRVASLPLPGPPQSLSLSPDRRRAYITVRSDSGSLVIVNVENPGAPSIVQTVPAGPGISGVLATADRIFISDSAQDAVFVMDAKTSQVIANVPMRIPGLENLRGLAPMGLAFHPATGYLLVAEAGANAVAIIDTKQMKLIGHLPVGWVPVRILIDGDTVYVANTRGQGVGPVTGQRQHDENFATAIRRGSISTFPIPSATELSEMTARVMAANGYTPKLMPAATPIPEAIRHVVLIVKGNRTYDDVLGDIRQAANGAVMGSPVLARFGRSGYADGRNARLSLQRVDVTPNHHNLAEMFSFSDNFYAEGGIPWARLERHGISFRPETNTPDLSRAEQFIHQMQQKYGEGKEPLPQLVLIHLPNDRVAEPRPEEGFPYDASYVAANDLALGRIVEFLSKSPWWREMAIFVTEEGPPAGLDHIDAHRSPLLCVGPYFKKSYAAHVNTSFPGLLKTIFRILRLPPIGLLDATASDLADTFADTPDFSPYTPLPVDPRLNIPAKAAEPEHLLR